MRLPRRLWDVAGKIRLQVDLRFKCHTRDPNHPSQKNHKKNKWRVHGDVPHSTEQLEPKDDAGWLLNRSLLIVKKRKNMIV